mmetsp:Transcript_42852/g.101738  ORF Transcript_42852/g.101738 Transcript_42852/m.101738 type:complete len:100 (-) Transcript_42852:1255-1554(-)
MDLAKGPSQPVRRGHKCARALQRGQGEEPSPSSPPPPGGEMQRPRWVGSSAPSMRFADGSPGEGGCGGLAGAQGVPPPSPLEAPAESRRDRSESQYPRP